MSPAITDHPTIKALKETFGDNLRIMGDGGPDPKNCILVREVKIYQGSGSNRRLVKDQIIIQALNREGRPVSPHKATWGQDVAARLISAVPELGAQITGGEGTHRAQKLRSIVPSVAGNHNLHALESLTPHAPLPSDPKASHFSAMHTRTLPTMLTWIDANDPQRPRRRIALIEQNVGNLNGTRGGTNRVDMAIISYRMGPTEIAAFRDGDGWKTGFGDNNLRPSIVEGTEVRLKNVDPNGYVAGKSAVEHHKKTIEGALGCLRFLNDKFSFKAVGEVQLRMIDILQNPTEVRVSRHVDTAAISASPATRAPEIARGEMRTVSTANVVCEYNQADRMTAVKRISSDLVKIFEKINARGIAEIQEALARTYRLVDQIEPKRPDTRYRPPKSSL